MATLGGSGTAAQVVVTKNYAGDYGVTFPGPADRFPDCPAPSAVDQVCAELTLPTTPVGDGFTRAVAACIAEVKQFAYQGNFAEIAKLHDAQRENLDNAGSVERPHSENEAHFIAAYLKLLPQIGAELAALPTLARQARDYVIQHLPTFIYMDEHRSFEGTANLDQVKQRLDQPMPQDETLLMIFKLAGLDLNKLIEQGNAQDQDTIRERQYDLQDAAQILTEAVAHRWAQDPYKVQFRADGQRFFTEIEELDKNIGMLPLEEQSRGIPVVLVVRFAVHARQRGHVLRMRPAARRARHASSPRRSG